MTDADFQALKGDVDAQEQLYAHIRWSPNGGSFARPICSHCGCLSEQHRRINGAADNHRGRWRCVTCYKYFSVLSGSVFANCKLPLYKLLIAIYKFVTSPKGESATQLAGPLEVSFKTAFVLLHKIRYSLWAGHNRSPMAGAVEADVCWVMKSVRNPRVHTSPRGRKINAGATNPNKQAIMVVRLRGEKKGQGAVRTVALPVLREDEQTVREVFKKLVPAGATVYTDEASAYTALAGAYDLRPVKHKEMYATERGDNQNQAESYFARFKRMLIGTYHRMSPQYLALYATECAWREDVRRLTLKERMEHACRIISQCSVAKPFIKYWGTKRSGDSPQTRLKRWMRTRKTRPYERWRLASNDEGLQLSLRF